MPNKPKILFIMYDGLTDPLGQSQVLSYIKHLSANYSFDIVFGNRFKAIIRYKK